MTSSFTSSVRFAAAHPAALALYCSDGRFTDAVEELLRHLGHPRLDTLTMPGGPALADLSSASFSELEAIRRAATFLIRSHRITHVILIAHEGCGYYRQRLAGDSEERIVRQQVTDLGLAARWLRGAHDGLTVAAFFARVSTGRIAFEAVLV